MKLALVALVFIGPTSKVVLVRLKPNLESSCFIPLSKQVQSGSGLALAHTGSNLFELDMYKTCVAFRILLSLIKTTKKVRSK